MRVILYYVLTGLLFSMRVIQYFILTGLVLSMRVIQYYILTGLVFSMRVIYYYILTGLVLSMRVIQYFILTGLVFSMRVIPLSSIKSWATRDTDFSTIRISGSSAAIRATQLRRNSCSYMGLKNIFILDLDVVFIVKLHFNRNVFVILH